MKKIKTNQTTTLNLKTKREEIVGEILYNGKIIQLYKAEVINGKVRIL